MAEINKINVAGEEHNIGLKLKLVESGKETTNEDAQLIFNTPLSSNKFYFIHLIGDIEFTKIFTVNNKCVETLYDLINDYEIIIDINDNSIAFFDHNCNIFNDLAKCSFEYQIYELPFSF